jgi:ferredoxin
MTVRKVIRIDEEKCDGCGQCATACAEGAIRIIEGKARLVSETYCDGLGACLGECPQGAITLEERQAEDFDPAAVEAHLARKHGPEKTRLSPLGPVPAHHFAGCPGSASRSIERPAQAPSASRPDRTDAQTPQLSNWPVQLHLVPVQAPFYDGADLLVAADCAPFAYADFHNRFIAGKKLIIGCPKLDDVSAYAEKLRRIFSLNDIRSVEVVFMEVPCCFGLVRLVQEALALSGKDIPLSLVKIGIQGDSHQCPSPGRPVVQNVSV